MSAEENKATYRRWIEEVFNNRQTDRIEAFIAPNMIEHTPTFLSGLEGAKQGVGIFLTAFPDLHITIDDLIAEGDKLVARITGTGTQRGEFAGIPPTGKHVAVTSIDVWRLSDGKCAEHWIQTDNLGMMQQLGVIPQPETAMT